VILAGAASGDLATVQLLLDKGADVNDAPNRQNPLDVLFAGSCQTADAAPLIGLPRRSCRLEDSSLPTLKPLQGSYELG
jgi:hypothetical protein